MKRILDLLLILVTAPVLVPLLAVCALVVRLSLGRPVLFRQPRAGLHGRPFTIVKFRTMRDLRDRSGNPLPDAERVTPISRLLRRSSLDELPALWNVWCGEMSLVGPRPLLLEYLPRYSATQARRHEVRPGITGWAQIHGRNQLSWERKFELDVWYVDHRSVRLDLRILLATVATVLRRDGISHANHESMPVFEGRRPDDR